MAINPINSVTWKSDSTKIWYGNNSSTSVNHIPCPSEYTWKLEDVSDSTAGRNENGYMFKERLQQICAIELSWAYLTTAEVKNLLNAFNDEYIQVSFLDPLNGDANNNYFSTKEFYVGDRSSPLYSTTNNRWENVSFNIIMRGSNG